MIDIPKNYNYSLWKTQDELNKDLYLFDLWNRKKKLIEYKLQAKTPQSLGQKIKKLIIKL